MTLNLKIILTDKAQYTFVEKAKLKFTKCISLQ